MTEFVPADEFEETPVDNVSETYRDLRDREGIPIHTGMYVEDVTEVETGYWERTQQNGAFVNLYGGEGVNDLQIHELEPGGETATIQHMYDQQVYVPQGNGITVIGEGDTQQTFEWGPHSLFIVPYNVPYRLINSSDREPARLVAETGLPLLVEQIRDDKLVFGLDDDQWRRYLDEEYYSADGKIHTEYNKGHFKAKDYPVYWEANFIPDISKFDKLESWGRRGAGGVSVFFPMPQSSLWSHISEFPVGTYKKAHRHGPGAQIGILSGTGYSLMWREGMDEIVKIDWQEGSMFAPPSRWYHQHFNTGTEPVRYFALHAPRLGAIGNNPDLSGHVPQNNIDYVDEDPAIRELFELESSVDSKMPEQCYTDPEFEM